MKKILSYALPVIMCIQIIMGVAWICINGFGIPVLEDSKMFVQAAKDGVYDEYTGFLYPVFLRLCYLSINSSIIVVILQFLAVFFSVFCLTDLLKDKLPLWFRLIVSSYVVTFPFMLQIIFSILPDAFCISLLLVWIRFYGYKKEDLLAKVLCFETASFLSKKYFHLFVIFWIVMAVSSLIKAKKEKETVNKKAFDRRGKFYFGCLFGGTVIIFLVSMLFVTPGANKRMPGTLNTGLMTTYAFEAFESDYTFWPYEAQLAIPFEDVRYITFSKDYVITKMGPMLMKEMDYSKVDKLAFGIALASLKMRSKESIIRTFTGIGEYLLFPVSVVKSFLGDIKSMSAFRLLAFSGDTPFYCVRFIYISFALLFILTAVLILYYAFILNKSEKKEREDIKAEAIKVSGFGERRPIRKKSGKNKHKNGKKELEELNVKIEQSILNLDIDKYLKESVIMVFTGISVFAGLFSISYFDYFYTVPVISIFIIWMLSMTKGIYNIKTKGE